MHILTVTGNNEVSESQTIEGQPEGSGDQINDSGHLYKAGASRAKLFEK